MTIFHIGVALTKADAARLIRDVEQSLSSNKPKIILNLSTEAATGNHGYGYLEKALRPLKALTQKMQGDIKYVVPKKLSERIPDTQSDLNKTTQELSQTISEEEIREEHLKLKEKMIYQEAQIKKLSAEVNILARKAKELMGWVTQPIAQKELDNALEHFRNLASELQAETPSIEKKD